jgi:sugar diacid utilization regulator
MRRAAERLNFPLFTIPGRVAFRDLIGLVQRQTLSSEIRTSGRLAAMQRYLNDSLRESNPRGCIVDRLGEWLDAEVAIVNEDGTVAEGVCALPASALGAQQLNTTTHATRLESEELHGWVLPIGTCSGSARFWLVVGVRSGKAEHPLLNMAARAALPLLEATEHLKEVRRAEERAAKRATLDCLLTSATPQEAEVAAARAAAWGVDPTHGVRVLIARRIGGSNDMSRQRLDQIVAQLEAARVPALATVRDDDVILLLPAEVGLETLERLLLEPDPNLFLGVGRVVTTGASVSASRADGDLALRWDRSYVGRCVSYDDLDLASILVAEVPAERIRPKVSRWLELLIENPIAFETLKVYFEHDLDVGRTSRALHLHPNSTRYRLIRLEEMLGVSLRRPGTIAALHLALLAHERIGLPVPRSSHGGRSTNGIPTELCEQGSSAPRGGERSR